MWFNANEIVPYLYSRAYISKMFRAAIFCIVVTATALFFLTECNCQDIIRKKTNLVCSLAFVVDPTAIDYYMNDLKLSYDDAIKRANCEIDNLMSGLNEVYRDYIFPSNKSLVGKSYVAFDYNVIFTIKKRFVDDMWQWCNGSKAGLQNNLCKYNHWLEEMDELVREFRTTPDWSDYCLAILVTERDLNLSSTGYKMTIAHQISTESTVCGLPMEKHPNRPRRFYPNTVLMALYSRRYGDTNKTSADIKKNIFYHNIAHALGISPKMNSDYSEIGDITEKFSLDDKEKIEIGEKVAKIHGDTKQKCLFLDDLSLKKLNIPSYPSCNITAQTTTKPAPNETPTIPNKIETCTAPTSTLTDDEFKNKTIQDAARELGTYISQQLVANLDKGMKVNFTNDGSYIHKISYQNKKKCIEDVWIIPEVEAKYLTITNSEERCSNATREFGSFVAGRIKEAVELKEEPIGILMDGHYVYKIRYLHQTACIKDLLIRPEVALKKK